MKTNYSHNVLFDTLNITHTFYDGNDRTCKILSANDDIVRPNIWKNVNYI